MSQPDLPTPTPSRSSRLVDAARNALAGMRRAVIVGISSPFRLVAWLFDSAVSPRGLALAGLAICALFATGTWLRPPISKDLRGMHLPLGIEPGRSLSVDSIISPTRPILLDSVAMPLLLVIALAIIPVLVAPRNLGWFAGVLMAFAMAATAASAFNHPGIVEQLEAENQQRWQIRSLMRYESETFLSGLAKPRVADPHLEESGVLNVVGLNPNDPLRGWMYIVYGPWLVGFAALLIMCATPGPVAFRLVRVAAWMLLGLVLTVAVTHRRIQAEYQYQLALVDESEQRYELALDRIEHCLELHPTLTETARIWQTTGRLHYRLGRRSDYADYFQARRYFQDLDHDHAQAAARQLMERAGSSPTVRRFASEVFSDYAVGRYYEKNYAAAEKAWTASCSYSPWTYDGPIGRGMAIAAANPLRAEEVAADIVPRISSIGDRVLACDLASIVGDAYFRSGQFQEARGYYEWSMELFSLPKISNTHAQRGLLGL